MFPSLLNNDIRQIFEQFRRSFDQMFENPRSSQVTAGDGNDWVFTPAVETGWTDDYLSLRVILPGVTRDEVKVSVQGNQLVIEGERKPPEEFGKEGYAFTVIPYGKFRRVIDLPNGLDLEKLSADLHDGVLDIRIPVAAAMKPREIPVSTESKTAESKRSESKTSEPKTLAA
jgi:HSP20 family protein